MHSIDEIIGAHDRPRSRIFHGELKAAEIDLPERSLGDDIVGAHAVVLLIVPRKMLDRHKMPLPLLHPEGKGGRHDAGEKRILGIIFEISPAERIPVNVHAGRKPNRDMEKLHLLGNCLSDLPEEPEVKALRKESPHRKGRAVLINDALRGIPLLRFPKEAALQRGNKSAGEEPSVLLPRLFLQAKSRRAVREHHRLHLPKRSIQCDRLPGGAGHGLRESLLPVLLSDPPRHKMKELLLRKPRRDFRGPPSGQRPLFPIGELAKTKLLRRKLRLRKRKLLPGGAELLPHFPAPFDLGELLPDRKLRAKLQKHSLSFEPKLPDRLRRPEASADPDPIAASLQEIGRSLLIVGSEKIDRNPKQKFLTLPRGEQGSLSKADQSPVLLLQLSGRKGSIDLDALPPRIAGAGILDPDRKLQGRLHPRRLRLLPPIFLIPGLQAKSGEKRGSIGERGLRLPLQKAKRLEADAEIRIGKPLSKAVAKRNGEAVKIAVADINPFPVFLPGEIAAQIGKGLRVRIVLIAKRPAVCEPSGGRDRAG